MQVVLKSRPLIGQKVTIENFSVVENSLTKELMETQLREGEILVQVVCLSVDPYMRCRFNESTGAEYLYPFKINESIISGGVARVIASKMTQHYPVGCFVVSQMSMPWKQYTIFDKQHFSDILVVPPVIHDPRLSCGPLGIAGLSAYHCVYEQCKPKKGSIAIVSSCAGAVGAIAGQLLIQEGVKVIGICGSKAKATWCVEEIGCATEAFCYKDVDYHESMKTLYDGAVDLYLDNVGGEISENVIALIKPHGRVVVCGQISTYNQDTTSDDYEYPDPLPTWLEEKMQAEDITRERFFVGWYHDQDKAAISKLQTMFEAETLKNPIEWVNGLENAGEAFCGMMDGQYKGKVMISLSE